MVGAAARNHIDGVPRHSLILEVGRELVRLCGAELRFHKRQSVGIQHMVGVVVDFEISVADVA